MRSKIKMGALRFGTSTLALLALSWLVLAPEILRILVANWWQIAIASTFVLLGHSLRIQRTSLLLNAAGVKSAFALHVTPLSLGLLLNVFLPFKLGEVARAFLLAKKLNISKTYALVVVFTERLLDVALVASALLVALLFSTKPISFNLWALAVAAVALSLGAIVSFSMLIRENRAIFKVISKVSKAFNQDIEYRLQHSAYSIIHGFQVFLFSRRETLKYSINFLGSWFLYVLAAVILANAFFGGQIPFGVTISPLITAANLSGGLGPLEFAYDLMTFIELSTVTSNSNHEIFAFGIASWLALQGSVVIVGSVVIAINVSGKSEQKPKPMHALSRISRSTPQAKNLRNFIELYFDRQELARNYHFEDVRGESQVLGFFRGGSDAITALIRKSDELRVRKSTDLKNKSKLKGQYDWLKRNSAKGLLVNAIEERTTESLYSIDLEFNERSESFFDYIHARKSGVSRLQLIQVFEFLDSQIWKIGSETNNQKALNSYLANRFYSRLTKAYELNHQLKQISEADSIVINGESFPNLEMLAAQILNDKSLATRIAHFRPNDQMHGDLTVDNLLIEIDLEHPILIDPSDDNEVRSTALEFSRMHQSLAGGYEFINTYQGAPEVRFEEANSVAVINYLNFQSKAYTSLDEHLLTLAKQYLTSDEFESIDFFTGIFFGRMLDHRVKINPVTAPIYYAKAIEFLDRYLKANS